MDTVAPRFRPHQQQYAANFPSRGRGDAVFGNQAHAHGVDQRVVGVGRVEVYLAAHVGHPNAIAVPGNAADHAVEQVAVVGFVERSEPQGVQQRDGPRPHGQYIPHDAADAGGGALQRLHRRRVVMGLYFEHHGQPFADVYHASVLGPGLRQDPGRLLGEQSEQGPGMFVAAVFAPQRPEHAQLDRVGLPAQPLHDHFVFSLSQGYRVQDLFGYRHGHPLLSSANRPAGQSRRQIVTVQCPLPLRGGIFLVSPPLGRAAASLCPLPLPGEGQGGGRERRPIPSHPQRQTPVSPDRSRRGLPGRKESPFPRPPDGTRLWRRNIPPPAPGRSW